MYTFVHAHCPATLTEVLNYQAKPHCCDEGSAIDKFKIAYDIDQIASQTNLVSELATEYREAIQKDSAAPMRTRCFLYIGSECID
ncbi:hypothetical protein Plhal703r1_c05g0029391 [Plasmopara halstedii]